MNENTEITTVSEDNLHRIVGGLFGAGPNRDSQFDVLGGLVADYKSTARSDETYRADSIAAACRQANTRSEPTWYGGTRQVTDQQGAANCFLQRIAPTAPTPTPTAP
jgi:hypothetical protein